MLSKDESAVLIEFLDRVSIKGHQERSNMNYIVGKVVAMGKESDETKMTKLKSEVDDATNS